MARQTAGESSFLVAVLVVVGALGGCGGGGGGGEDGQPPPDVSGTFTQDMGSFVSSNCDPVVNDQLVSSGTCTYEVDQNGRSVTLTSICPNNSRVFRGSVDGTGYIIARHNNSTTNGPCVTSLTVELSVDATDSPTTGRFSALFRFSNGCLVSSSSCTAVLQGRFTRQ